MTEQILVENPAGSRPAVAEGNICFEKVHHVVSRLQGDGRPPIDPEELDALRRLYQNLQRLWTRSETFAGIQLSPELEEVIRTMEPEWAA